MRCPLLAAFAVLLLALPARAERPHDSVTLTYLPSGAAIALCPEADYLENEVFVRLRYALFQPTGSKHLTVKVDRASGMFRAVGEMRDDEGNLLFAGTYPAMDCTFAVFSIAVALSIHYAELPEPAAPSPPEATTPSVPAPEPVKPVAPPAPAAPLPEPRRFQGGLSSVFSIGNAPSILGGIGWSVGVRWPSVSLALEGRALFAPSATLERATVRGDYHFGFVALSGAGCYHATLIFVCGRAELGRLSFGNGSVSLSPDHMAIMDLGVRLGGVQSLTPWFALQAYFEIVLQPLSGAFNESPGDHAVWSQTGLAGSIGIGSVFTFQGI